MPLTIVQKLIEKLDIVQSQIVSQKLLYFYS